MGNDDTPSDTTDQVSYVGVKPPPFWKINPSLWFFSSLKPNFSEAQILVVFFLQWKKVANPDDT